jgi:hypothetical protein
LGNQSANDIFPRHRRTGRPCLDVFRCRTHGGEFIQRQNVLPVVSETRKNRLNRSSKIYSHDLFTLEFPYVNLTGEQKIIVKCWCFPHLSTPFLWLHHYVLQLAEAIGPDLESQALRRVAQDSRQGLAVFCGKNMEIPWLF